METIPRGKEMEVQIAILNKYWNNF